LLKKRKLIQVLKKRLRISIKINLILKQKLEKDFWHELQQINQKRESCRIVIFKIFMFKILYP